MTPRIRGALLVVVALGAISGIGYATWGAYPFTEWLLARVLGYHALVLVWAAGCLSAGTLALHHLSPRAYRPAERLVLAFPLGVLIFSSLFFVLGLLRQLHTVTFVLLPLVLLAAGWRACRQTVEQALRAFRETFRPTPLDLTLLAFGALGLACVYVPVLTPHNIQHDARWYHLPIAQHFAAQGAITSFPEGWFLGAYPHLASFLYTWAFLLPAGIVHRILLAAHLEFIVVVATLASLPVVLRRIVPGVRLPFAWAVVFLFPCFLAYDSSVSTGADHIAALFAPAGLLALLRAMKSLSPRDAALVGLAAAGAALTKYSAACVALPLLVALALRVAYYARAKGFVPRATRPLGFLLGAFVLATTPHWLANLAWYGDPLYPHLHAWFTPRPWDPQAALYLRVFNDYAVLRPTRDLAGAFETLLAAATLGFRVHETFGLRGEMPIFGFLFAASLYSLPFLRAGRALWLAAAVAFASVVVWYFTNHRDRYLQACFPWLVLVTASVLSQLWWRTGAPGRVAAALLVTTQLAVGAGTWLMPLHVMIKDRHAVPQVIELVRAGYERRYADRFEPSKDWGFADWTALGARLPRGARVLVHEDRLWLGLDAPVVVDEAQWQAGIRYLNLTTPAAVHDHLAPYGVTHVITGKAHGDGGGHGLAGDLAFFDFISRYARRVADAGRLTLFELPRERPPAAALPPSLVLTCNQSLAPGLYETAQIVRGKPEVPVPPDGPVPAGLIARAEYVVLEKDCGFALPAGDLPGFRAIGARHAVSFQVRER